MMYIYVCTWAIEYQIDLYIRQIYIYIYELQCIRYIYIYSKLRLLQLPFLTILTELPEQTVFGHVLMLQSSGLWPDIATGSLLHDNHCSAYNGILMQFLKSHCSCTGQQLIQVRCLTASSLLSPGLGFSRAWQVVLSKWRSTRHFHKRSIKDEVYPCSTTWVAWLPW